MKGGGGYDVKSISTPPLVNSLQRIEDTELSSEDLRSLAKMLAEMIHRNLKKKEKQTERTVLSEAKTRIDHDTEHNKQR